MTMAPRIAFPMMAASTAKSRKALLDSMAKAKAKKKAPALGVKLTEAQLEAMAPGDRIAAEAAMKAAGKPKRIDREGPIHLAILHFLQVALPKAIIHHSPNAIGLSGKIIARLIARNAKMGTRKGWPDLTVVLPANIGTVYFEVKEPGNGPDADQAELHEELRALGHRVAVVTSIDDVAQALFDWGIWMDRAAHGMVSGRIRQPYGSGARALSELLKGHPKADDDARSGYTEGGLA